MNRDLAISLVLASVFVPLAFLGGVTGEVATGMLMWTGRATSPTGGDVTSQLSELTRVMLESLSGSGLL